MKNFILRIKGFIGYPLKKKKITKRLLLANFNFKVMAAAIVLVLAVGYFIYQEGFSYQISVNGNTVGYVKRVAHLGDALNSVDAVVEETFGNTAFYNDEVENLKVRNQTQNIIDTESLQQKLISVIDVYKPAAVIKVDDVYAVALETEDDANTVLEAIKTSYLNKVDSELDVVSVAFKNDIKVELEDVSVYKIYSKEIASYVLNQDESDKSFAEPVAAKVANLESRSFLKTSNTDIQRLPLDVVTVVNETSIKEVPFNSLIKEDASKFVGTNSITQKGINGKNEIVTEIRYLNGVKDASKVVKETILEAPVEKITVKGTKPHPKPVYNGNLGRSIVSEAYKYLGIPYRAGGSSPATGFDCSGFTKYVYSKFGYNLSGSVSGQRNSSFAKVSRNDLQPGDIVTYTGHVGIYIGGGKMIHAPFAGRNVEVTSIYNVRGFIGGIRP